MTIFDSFIMNDETDLLECRLMELQDCNVTHILAEATKDHHGRAKPLYYGDNKSRYEQWNNRIIHIVADDLREGDPWGNLKRQRNWILKGLKDAENSDVLIYSDVDEILNEDCIKRAATPGRGLKFYQRFFLFAVDWEWPYKWRGSAACHVENVSSVEAVRTADTFSIHPGDAGWHFSWLGGPDGIIAKTKVYCHDELTKRIEELNEQGDLYEKGHLFWYTGSGKTPRLDSRQGFQCFERLTPRDVNETWPRYINEGKCPEIWFRPRG